MDLSIYTYNILAESYVRPEWHGDAQGKLLPPKKRLQQIGERVSTLDADILCLQEVETEAFFHLSKVLKDYKGFYSKKGKGKKDGCTLFYRTIEASIQSVYYDEPIGTSGHVYQLLSFNGDGREIKLINTHLKWSDPNVESFDRHVYHQIQQLLDEQPTIMCGDFNLLPEDPINPLVHGFEYCNLGPSAIVDGFKRKIDYIFYTQEKAQPLRPAPLHQYNRLPQGNEPSDHVPVGVKFSF